MHRILLFIFILFTGTALAMADHQKGCCFADLSIALRFDSIYMYNETGEMTGKKVSAYDAEGREVMSADFDFANGSWIGNIMKLTNIVEKKEVTVDFFWEINSWVPSDMTVVEYDELQQKQLSFFQWEDDSWILAKTQMSRWGNR